MQKEQKVGKEQKETATSFIRSVLVFGLVLVLILCLKFFFVDKGNSAGEKLYVTHCANCHLESGLGVRGLIPPLAKADYLVENQKLIPCIIRQGQSGKILVNGKEYDWEMPGNELITDSEITVLINYLNKTWGNNIPKVKHQETLVRLRRCP